MLSIIISAFWAIVVRLEVPEIDSGALSVIFPVVAVAERFPPTVDAAKFNPASLTTVALPVPWVARAIVPSTASVSRLITPLLASVVAERLPPTFTDRISVIPDALPLVNVRFPPTDDVAILRAVVPLSTVALPDVPLVLNATAPVSALVLSSRVIVALLALVVKEEGPPTISAVPTLLSKTL